MDFIRWRKAKGYEVAPFKRVFWGRKSWNKNGDKAELRRLRNLCRLIFKPT